MASTRPWPWSTRSPAASTGSLCSSFAIPLRFLPLNRSFSGFRALASTMFSHPPEASTMFHQPGEPVFTSRLSRARIAGSLRRARSESWPPSKAQEGMVASSPVPPAGGTYWSAAPSPPPAPRPPPRLPPAPYVTRIGPAVRRQGLRHFDQLLGGGEAARRVDERRGHSHRAAPHGGVHDGPHARQLLRGRLPRVEADHGVARLGLAEVGPEVDADPRLLQAPEVVRDLP